MDDTDFKIVINKYAGILDPPPSGALAFLDEDSDSIQNGSLGIRRPGLKIYDFWNLPGSRHDYGCNLAFADGHAEHWEWLEDGIAKSAAILKRSPADSNGTVPSLPTTSDDRDLKRLQATGPWQ